MSLQAMSPVLSVLSIIIISKVMENIVIKSIVIVSLNVN
jgi:hypothetical protein